LVSGVSIANEQPEPLAVTGYDIDATIEGNYKFSARTTIKLAGRSADPQQWVPFYLFDELEVDSVLTDAGAPLTFSRKNHFGGLWIRSRSGCRGRRPGSPASFPWRAVICGPSSTPGRSSRTRRRGIPATAAIKS